LRLYEAMFLVDNNLARTNYEEVENHIKGILERFGGEVVQMVKWAERRLAYPIKFNNKEYVKGTYILVHFNSEPDAIIKMNRQFRLSETVIRHMILRDEDGLFDESKKHDELFEADTEGPREKPSRARAVSAPDEAKVASVVSKVEAAPEAKEEEPAAEPAGEPAPEAGVSDDGEAKGEEK